MNPFTPDAAPTRELPIPGLVPLPVQMSQPDGSVFRLGPTSVIVADGQAAPVAELLAEQLRPATGYAIPVVDQRPVDRTEQTVIILALDATFRPPASPSPDEGYTLAIGTCELTITAGSPHGLWNGTQTLRQLFGAMIHSPRPVLVDWVIPAITITDAPRLAHRGVQVDVARSFLTPDEIRPIIDALSAVKINRLHLHLSDDQGWRLEITNQGRSPDDPVDYTRLAQIGGATAMQAVNDPERPQTNELGRTGYFTQQEYRDLVRYAADRFVTVIPEIDAPGHTIAMLHAIAELNSPASDHSEGSKPPATEYGTASEQSDGTVGASTLDVANPQTWMSLRHILGQLAALTEGAWLHVGGDESHVTPRQEYVEFVTRMVELVHDLGKRPIGWNEYAVGGLQPGDVVQYWVGDTEVTRQAAERGAKIVVSKSDAAYLDQKYTDRTPIGLDWAGGGDVEAYYDWDPARLVENLDESALLGVEAPMWSETLRGRGNNEFLMFPRALAMAEIGWTPQQLRDVPGFLDRLGSLGAGWLVSGTNFHDTPAVTWTSAVAGVEQVRVRPAHDGAIETEPEHEAIPSPSSVLVAVLAAPGTRVAGSFGHGGTALEGGTRVEHDIEPGDASRAADGPPLTAVVDDGLETVPAWFECLRPRSDLAAGSLYQVRAPLRLDSVGSRQVNVRFSDGRTVRSVLQVVERAEGSTEPSMTGLVGALVDANIPTLSLDRTSVRDDSRVQARLEGFEPETHVRITLDQVHQGFVRTDATGSAQVSLPIGYRTAPGDHTWVATGPDGRSAQAVIRVVNEQPRTQSEEGDPPL